MSNFLHCIFCVWEVGGEKSFVAFACSGTTVTVSDTRFLTCPCRWSIQKVQVQPIMLSIPLQGSYGPGFPKNDKIKHPQCQSSNTVLCTKQVLTMLIGQNMLSWDLVMSSCMRGSTRTSIVYQEVVQSSESNTSCIILLLMKSTRICECVFMFVLPI